MSYLYPVYFKLDHKLCLVVGGGRVAERKIGSLLECGAMVRVVSPAVTPLIGQWNCQEKLELRQREYQPNDLDDAFLVFAATNQPKVNQRIVKDCQMKNLPINVVDDPENCNFTVPSVVRRGRLSIAVSTKGASPMLAAKIRRQLAEQFGPEYGEFLEILADLRQRILYEVEEIEERQEIFKKLIESDILELLRENKHGQVKERIDKCLSR